jgi:hypothetical protein
MRRKMVTDHSYGNAEAPAIIAAFKAGMSGAAVSRQVGEPRSAIEKLLTKARIRTDRPRQPEQSEEARSRASHPFRKQDLAFQRRMIRAAEAGKENPPMIGIWRDSRPLDAPRIFASVPHSSGCSSPAGACADLMQQRD